MNNDYSPLGLLSFLTFGLSIIAAVMAIDMYKLLRTGDFGKTWRLLIIASVMFALLQVVKLGEILNFRTMSGYHLSEIVELCFVMALAYAFYQQRQVFTRQSKKALSDETDEETEDEAQYALSDDHFEDKDDDEDDEDEVQRMQWPDVSSVKAGQPSLRQ
jgi:hypothetical protein